MTTLALVLAMAAFAAAIAFKTGFWRPFGPTPTALRAGVTADDAAPDIEEVAEGLDIPWDVAFLPDGGILVTERSGTLVRVGADGHAIPVPGVAHVGEGGLLGIALHPGFTLNGYLYLYMTTAADDGLVNRVVRYRYDGGGLHEPTVIVGGIPGAQYHDGGAVRFGPDGKLYVSTGDAGMSSAAQDTRSLAGKILRLNEDGTVPDDNPFGNAVWSYGHRNPQGIAWDAFGRMWATEHGRSGLLSGYDELNLIRKGENYGWPVIQGDEQREGMSPPVVHSGPDETWAPSGLAIKDGVAYFAGLRGESLYRGIIVGDGIEGMTSNLRGNYGRLRASVVGPDGRIYVTTSNKDGRGAVRVGDDRIIRIDTRMFEQAAPVP